MRQKRQHDSKQRWSRTIVLFPWCLKILSIFLYVSGYNINWKVSFKNTTWGAKMFEKFSSMKYKCFSSNLGCDKHYERANLLHVLINFTTRTCTSSIDSSTGLATTQSSRILLRFLSYTNSAPSTPNWISWPVFILRLGDSHTLFLFSSRKGKWDSLWILLVVGDLDLWL